MSGAADGLLAGTPVAVNLTLTKQSSNGSTAVAFDAATKGPLKLSSLLDKIWERQPAAVASFFSAFTIPPVAVSYSSTESSFTIQSTSSVLAFNNFLTFDSSQITFTTKPAPAARIETMLSAASMGLKPTKATVETVNDILTLKVRC
jgi:hypothetical protein